MITKEQKIRLAIFLVVSLILLIAIFSIFILPKLKTVGDVYCIDFREMSVNGIIEGADVKYQGVRIGKVITLQVNPDNLRSVLIYIRIKKGFTIKTDMRASLQYSGITGMRFVEISGGTTGAQDLEPGENILPKKGLGERAEDIVLNVDSVVEAINDVLNPENREKISQTLTNIEKGTAIIADMLERRKASLENVVVNMETVTRQLAEVTTNLNKFSTYLLGVSEKLNPERIEKLVNLTDTFLQDLSKRISDQELGKLITNVDTLMKTANMSVRKVEEGFLSMSEEFNKTLVRLRQSIDNIARFTRELREDPTVLIRKKAEKRSKK
ncbi:MAG: phospholipid/cholesterol/gamma-HCH transport system substrate-binding protein [Acidobacteriota bacterium]|nr:phospholipid/cholesterol/gamma-HCH transport system substrate-binding protein [Acidobacteriota bacterium]